MFDGAGGRVAWGNRFSGRLTSEIEIAAMCRTVPPPKNVVTLDGYIEFADTGVCARRSDWGRDISAWSAIYWTFGNRPTFMSRLNQSLGDPGYVEIDVREFEPMGGILNGTYRMLLKVQGPYPDIHLDGRSALKRANA